VGGQPDSEHTQETNKDTSKKNELIVPLAQQDLRMIQGSVRWMDKPAVYPNHVLTT
jgi:hypothetical protein